MPKKPLILCVEDDWNGLEGRKVLLEEIGCRVLASTSGVEALHLFASYAIDLVLLEYHMPEMRGDAMAACMKASHPEIPIVPNLGRQRPQVQTSQPLCRRHLCGNRIAVLEGEFFAAPHRRPQTPSVSRCT
jgi:CheY-like chemotaxis protein